MANNKKEALIYLSEKLPIACHLGDEKFPITCLEKINAALIEAVYMLGYDYIRYSYWIKNIVQQEQEINSFSVNLSNFPEDWESFYNKESVYLIDPVVRIIQENIGHKNLIYGTWSDAYVWAMQSPLGNSVEEKEKYVKSITQLIGSSREHHLNSGYYYSWGDNTLQIVLSLASPQSSVEQGDASAGDFIKTIHSIVILINQAIAITQGCSHCSKSLRIDGSNPIHLSQAELYVLQLFHKHRNATLKQIAIHYGRSVDTVNHHLRSIRSKLNTPGASGHSLAAYAVELKLI